MTIYDVLNLANTTITKSKTTQCGSGTIFIDGICQLKNKSQGGGCLVATAAYGSEMSSQVQMLREIRDNKVMRTSFGQSFMESFNIFYYSFSPQISDYQRENPVFKEIVKIGITPMITTLSIMTLSHENSEIDVIFLGITSIGLILGMYVAAPTILIYKIKNKF